VYLVFAFGVARTKAPWCDEGWFANPAYNLAYHGTMSTNVLEPSGHFLNAYIRGIQERTYIVVPNHLVALAGWFRVFGFSLVSMRTYSILWGVVTLLIFYYIAHRLVPDPGVAQLGVFLLAVDFMFIWTTADGRMEAPASALALGAVAAYLHFGEANFRVAVIVSQILGATAMFTHPNAIFGVLAIAVLTWYLDRPKLKWQYILWAAAPYLLFALLWSIYIVQSPADFAAQFFANAVGRGSARWKIVIQPWLAIALELMRHAGTYMASGLWQGVMNQAMIFVPIGYVSALIWFMRHHRRRPPGARVFLSIALTYLLGMTFLNGFKAAPYILYLVPFYDVVLAAWIIHLWRGTSERKLFAASLLAAFLALQITTTVQHIRADEYGRDDARLGIYSGLEPDVLVMDRSYRDFARLFSEE
jgi:4-amino-4-deoxy-L-arabinose transferase-like glycosyltransferase